MESPETQRSCVVNTVLMVRSWASESTALSWLVRSISPHYEHRRPWSRFQAGSRPIPPWTCLIAATMLVTDAVDPWNSRPVQVLFL